MKPITKNTFIKPEKSNDFYLYDSGTFTNVQLSEYHRIVKNLGVSLFNGVDDPKDKTFERLQKVWSDAESVSNAIKSLGVLAGIGQETKDDKKEVVQVNKKPFSPENMADAVGELAGKRY